MDSLATLFGMTAIGLATYSDLRRFDPVGPKRVPVMAMKTFPATQLMVESRIDCEEMNEYNE